jgi:hypothetical protein
MKLDPHRAFKEVLQQSYATFSSTLLRTCHKTLQLFTFLRSELISVFRKRRDRVWCSLEIIALYPYSVDGET